VYIRLDTAFAVTNTSIVMNLCSLGSINFRRCFVSCARILHETREPVSSPSKFSFLRDKQSLFSLHKFLRFGNNMFSLENFIISNETIS
jgi:hypothetical protein